MQALLDFFVNLGSLIISLVKFVIGMIGDLIYVVGLLGSLLLRIGDMIGWLPSACVSMVITTFGVVLIYKILGREG